MPSDIDARICRRYVRDGVTRCHAHDDRLHECDLLAARALADELAEALTAELSESDCGPTCRSRYILLKYKQHNRSYWQDAVDSPEMPGPGYDAQTRPLPPGPRGF